MITSKVKYTGHLQTECEHIRSQQKIVTDAPVDNNGKGSAFSPTDLAATSLASCMITIMGIAAEKQGFSIEGMEAEVTKVMSQDSPRRIVEINVTIDLRKCDLTDKQLKMIKNIPAACPVSHSLHPDIQQIINFIE